MAGGIGDKPFQLNPKCVVFTFILMAMYSFLPEGCNQVAALIAMITPVIIYSYYKLYRCKSKEEGGKGASTIALLATMLITSLILVALYYYLPRGYVSMYVLIFIFGYTAMAYFDYIFDCSIPLEVGVYSFTHLFKPEAKEKSIKF